MSNTENVIQCPFGAREKIGSHNYEQELLTQAIEYIYSQEFINYFFSSLDKAFSQNRLQLIRDSVDTDLEMLKSEVEEQFFTDISNYILEKVKTLNPILTKFPELVPSITLSSLKEHILGNENLFVNLSVPAEFVAILGEGGLFEATIEHVYDFLKFCIQNQVKVSEIPNCVTTHLGDSNFQSKAKEDRVYCPAKTLVRCASVYLYLKYQAFTTGRIFVLPYDKPLSIANIIKQYIKAVEF